MSNQVVGTSELFNDGSNLSNKTIYYYKFPDGQVFEGRIRYGTLEKRDKDHRTCSISPVYDHLKRFPDTKPKLLTNDTHYKTENIIYLYKR